MEVALNRRGVFFKKLAAPDLEFFEARAAGLPARGLLLSINAPIAEAALPRAAQRRGYWKIEGRQYPAGTKEPFELHRAVDWQLSGPGTDDAVPAPAAGDWFAVQYETADDGRVSFLWRVLTRAKHRGLWGDVERSVSRHLVSRMAHFADVHPEYEAIDMLLGRSDKVDEEEELFAAEEGPYREHAPLPAEAGDFSESTLRQSDRAIVQYTYYESYATLAPAPLPASAAREATATPASPPLPKIDSLLNLAKALQPIVVKEIPAARHREEAPRPEPAPAKVAVAPAAAAKAPSEKGRWLRTASASALGILLLTALGARNTDTIAGLFCEQLGVHCVSREVATVRLPVAPVAQPSAEQSAETARSTVPPPQIDEITQTASIPAPPEPETNSGNPAQAAIPAASQAPYVDEVVWRFLRDTRSSDQLKNFLSQFPTSSYRIPAQTRLAAIEPKVTECDLLAAHPLDQLRSPEVTGVSIQLLNSILATRACERAVAEYPDAARFPLQLGRGYEKARRYEEAHRWYARGADLGNAQAMHNLGFQLATGQGVRRDYSEARKWFAKASAAGNGPAMVRLGELYANGYGVPRDYAEARRWFLQAAERGIPLAMAHLGDLYANGRGVPLDYPEARAWYRKAAQLGSASAMYNLAVLNEKGRGGPRDYGEARKWYSKAADIGDEEARRSLVRLRR